MSRSLLPGNPMSSLPNPIAHPWPRRLAARAATLLAPVAGLAARSSLAYDDLRPVSEPATPPRAAPDALSGASAVIDEAFFLKLGFSFMVGLAVGYALKIAFKLALIALGLILIGVFALQYEGLVRVDWSALEGHYDTWAGWLSANGSAFVDFMGDNLSNAASFVAGLLLGLKL